MTRRFAIVLFSLALPVLVHAQVVYSFRGPSTIVAIDPATGAETTVTTGASGFIGISTFDPVGRRIFFTGPSTVLWSFAIDTGSLTQVPLASSYAWIEYDPVTEQIFALSGTTLVAIDPATGTQTTVTTGVSNFIGISTFDVTGRRLYFTGPGTVLWTVNVDTGVATQVPLAGSYAWVEYDPVTEQIFALSGTTLVAIDPATGTQTTVTTGVSNFIGISTFDVTGRRLYFTSPGTVLWTLNVDTGVATQVPLAGSYSWVEFATAAPPIPTLHPAILVALMAALTVIGALRIRA